MDNADIFVSGGGIAGLAAAAILSQAGWRVCLADPAPPAEDAETAGADLRSTAFLQPARDLLDRAGLWDRLAPHAVPLDVLRIVDTSGWPPAERARRDFRASDLDIGSFGWNVPNWLTRRELTDAVRARVDLRLGVGFRDMLVRDREVLVTLTDGQRLRARLVVGADGRASPVREAAGFAVRTIRYGQKALAFAVTHPEPHANVSTEIYNAGGAFTLVPLPDSDGQPSSAVVWMNDGPRAVTLAQLDAAAFSAEATTRSCALLGPLSLRGGRRLWPVITQVAGALTAPRCALMAEAAHVLPPIGAQGLNTSLHDVAALAQALGGADDPGADAVLATYGWGREADIRARAALIDLYNRVCRSGEAPIEAFRRTGLAVLHGVAPLRRGIMRAGLGGGPADIGGAPPRSGGGFATIDGGPTGAG